MPDNELQVDYQTVLADLRAKRDELNTAIAAIERLTGISSSQSAAAPNSNNALSAEVRPDSFFGLSIPDGARKFLKMSKAPKSSKEIADALDKGGLTHSSADFVNTVGSILNRADKNGGDIVRVARGQYGLAEWYPGMKRKRGKGKPEEDAENPTDI
jgi:hypothetical protein